MIEWKTDEAPMGTRLLVRDRTGRVMIGKRTFQGWIDDRAYPIPNVVEWSNLP